MPVILFSKSNSIFSEYSDPKNGIFHNRKDKFRGDLTGEAFLAEKSVGSPQKVFVFIIKKKYLSRDQTIQK